MQIYKDLMEYKTHKIDQHNTGGIKWYLRGVLKIQCCFAW